jgi:hypothetical protein
VARLAAVSWLMFVASHRCSRSPCLSGHFYQNFSGLRRTIFLPQECDAGTARAILGLQANLKSETADRSQYRCLRLDSSKFPGQRHQRICVTGTHALV